MDELMLIMIILGSLIIFGCFAWLFSSLGKWISFEEKEAKEDLTYKTNPFSGSAKHTYRK
ncbi:hypothetical protein N0O92_12330 [Alkalihalobacillus sp. MEB130]|uniref:hypothetical protein n=1 Tax=Alkalihalobacillus sp. MEB130 TaxID=2976704 RepID=UPI0028E04AFC|nr:hypothetical protein [Alkalihalobacillus sp. MEB130]MDT8861021.1 hypothetical protein [Alkalihalobacillus sp. MEB130]